MTSYDETKLREMFGSNPEKIIAAWIAENRRVNNGELVWTDYMQLVMDAEKAAINANRTV